MLFINFTQAQQNQNHYYYIEEATVDILKPNAILENTDETIALYFSNEKITNRSENPDGSETFYAQSINEGAKYNWYDESGVLVYSGSDFTVSSLVAKEYKLEVVADYDGHIDYEMVVTEDKRKITSMSPNPATTSVDIGYTVSETENAYVMLTHSTTGLNYNYVLNATNTSQLIPVDQLQQGTYIVNLVVNGEVLDTKNLLIN